MTSLVTENGPLPYKMVLVLLTLLPGVRSWGTSHTWLTHLKGMLFMLRTERLLKETGRSLHSSVPVTLNLSHTKLSFVFCKAPFLFLLLRFNRPLLHFWMRYEGPAFGLEKGFECCFMFLSAFNFFGS